MISWLFTPALTLEDKFKNVVMGLCVALTYVGLLTIGLKALGMYPFPSGRGWGFNLKYYIIFACVLTPLWEELAFRWFPLKIARLLGKDYIIPIMVVSTLIFGWGHGRGIYSLLFQGVVGMIICITYVKNNYSYWSVVAMHSMYNAFALFIRWHQWLAFFCLCGLWALVYLPWSGF